MTAALMRADAVALHRMAEVVAFPLALLAEPAERSALQLPPLGPADLLANSAFRAAAVHAQLHLLQGPKRRRGSPVGDDAFAVFLAELDTFAAPRQAKPSRLDGAPAARNLASQASQAFAGRKLGVQPMVRCGAAPADLRLADLGPTDFAAGPYPRVIMEPMRRATLRFTGWMCTLCVLAGCVAVPVPVSTALLHARQPAPAAVASMAAGAGGRYEAPAFDAQGRRLAVHDTGSGRVRLFDVASLAPLGEVVPVRHPRSLAFSPQGGWLILRAYEGAMSDFLAGRKRPDRVAIDAPEALQDMIDRVEVHGLQGERALVDLQCDQVHTVPPKAGWLWAQRLAVVPGVRRSVVLGAAVSADDRTLTLLCEGGRTQHWDLRSGARLADGVPSGPGPALMTLVGLSRPAVSRDGGLFALPLPDHVHLWQPATGVLRPLAGDCALAEVPPQAFSADAQRIVLVCSHGLGTAIRVWDLNTERERPLEHAGFGLTGGMPVLRAPGVALSPDGRHVAAALLSLTGAMVVSPLLPGMALGVERSDLRIWRVSDGGQAAVIGIDDLVVAPVDALRGVDLAFSPDGSLLVLAGQRLRVFRFADLAGAD